MELLSVHNSQWNHAIQNEHSDTIDCKKNICKIEKNERKLTTVANFRIKQKCNGEEKGEKYMRRLNRKVAWKQLADKEYFSDE